VNKCLLTSKDKKDLISTMLLSSPIVLFVVIFDIFSSIFSNWLIMGSVILVILLVIGSIVKFTGLLNELSDGWDQLRKRTSTKRD